MTLSTLLQEIVQHGGFLTDETIGQLAELDRLRQVLVRCGCGRFTCPAQDVVHFIQIIEAEGSDYIRDVSLLSSDDANRGVFRLHTVEGSYQPLPKPSKPNKNRSGFPDSSVRNFREEDCGGAFDGFGVSSDADPGL